MKEIGNITKNICIFFACMSVCLFVSNKRQNGWTDRAPIFCGTSHGPREGFWMIEFKKIASNKIRFWKLKKPRNFFA